jgi:hypothetical protein
MYQEKNNLGEILAKKTNIEKFLRVGIKLNKITVR